MFAVRCAPQIGGSHSWRLCAAKSWKRMVTKVTYVGEGFTRKPPKYERFIRPMAMRFKKAHVTHPELQATFHLDIIGVKKNPNSQLYTTLGVITKGTVIEVNVSELGLVTTSGKVVWGTFQAMRCTAGTSSGVNASGDGVRGQASTHRSPTTRSATGALTRSCSCRLRCLEKFVVVCCTSVCCALPTFSQCALAGTDKTSIRHAS